MTDSEEGIPAYVFDAALKAANSSPCAKSKRGAVVWEPLWGKILGVGHNAPPKPLQCDGSEECRASCGKVCVHAEMSALLAAGLPGSGYALDVVHLKTVDGLPVPSGPPSCWQCSRNMAVAGVEGVWLLHKDGWRRYEALEFHRLTLRHHGLPGG
jgi:deoxycytidylate deaminase